MCLAGILWPNADKRHVHAIFKLFPCRRILRHGDHLRGARDDTPKNRPPMCYMIGGRADVDRDGQKRTMPDIRGKKCGPGSKRARVFLRLFPSCRILHHCLIPYREVAR
jgi:hypothetical protein